MEDRLKEFKSQLERHARKRVARNPLLFLETEDLVQEGMAAMWITWLRYKDSNKTAEDMTKLCFKAALNRMSDNERREKHKRRVRFESKDPDELFSRPYLDDILDVRFRIRTVFSNLSEPGQKVMGELLDRHTSVERRYYYKRAWEARDYAERLGLTDEAVKLAFKEIKQGLSNSGFEFRLYKVKNNFRGGIGMGAEKDKSIDPLDYGLSVPEPEEEVGWDPVLDEPNTREEIEAEESHEAEKDPGEVVDLDQPTTLGDLGEMGAEIDREEAGSVSSKSEKKLDKPKRKSRKKRDKNDYMKGFEVGSDGAKVWAYLEEHLLDQGQVITHENIRHAYQTVLCSDRDKATKQARFLVFTLVKKKKLLTRISRGVFKRANNVTQ